MPTVLVSYLAAKNPDKNPDERLEQKIELGVGQIIFDGLEDQGIILPHGCLAGSCGSCRIEILEGAENLSEPGYVEKNTIDAIKKNADETNQGGLDANKNIRLSCRAKVFGPIKIAVRM